MKPRGGLLFYRDFWWRQIFLIFFLQWASTQARSWEKVNFSSNAQRKSEKSKRFTVSQVFSCVCCERNENRKMKFHRWCLSGKKSRKAKVHTLQFHYLLKCNVIQWQRMMVVVVVLLHCHNVDFKDTK